VPTTVFKTLDIRKQRIMIPERWETEEGVTDVLHSSQVQVHKQGEHQAEGEAGSPLSGGPDVGLDPGILGPWPEPRADA